MQRKVEKPGRGPDELGDHASGKIAKPGQQGETDDEPELLQDILLRLSGERTHLHGVLTGEEQDGFPTGPGSTEPCRRESG